MPSSCCFCPGCKSGYASDTKRGKNSGETLPNLFRSPKSILITRILHEILSKDFKILQEIGRGGFATVYKANWISKKKCVALKKIKKNILRDRFKIERVEQEIQIHSHLCHPNIVKFEAWFKDEEYFTLVLEYCNKGSLEDYMKKETHKFSEPEAHDIIKEVINGVAYLHDKFIIHRDINLRNILLTECLCSQIIVKLADFSLVTQLSEPDETRHTMLGTPNFMPPETITGEPQSFESDCWSLGCVLYALLVGKPPFAGKRTADVCSDIVMSTLKIPDYISDDSRTLISDLLKKNKEERPTIFALFQYSFFKKYGMRAGIFKCKCDLHNSRDSGRGSSCSSTPLSYASSDSGIELLNSAGKRQKNSNGIMKHNYPLDTINSFEHSYENNSKVKYDLKMHQCHSDLVKIKPRHSERRFKSTERPAAFENLRNKIPLLPTRENVLYESAPLEKIISSGTREHFSPELTKQNLQNCCCHQEDTSKDIKTKISLLSPQYSHSKFCDQENTNYSPELPCFCSKHLTNEPHFPCHHSTSRSVDYLKENDYKCEPLCTIRLPVKRYETKNFIVSILKNGQVSLEFFKVKRKEKYISLVCKISSDGLKVSIYKPKGNCIVRDEPPSLPDNPREIQYFSFESLPERYYKKYLCAKRFIDIIRARTPKITFYGKEAKIQMMENLPDPDFYVDFYEGGKITKVGSKTSIYEKNGRCHSVTDYIPKSFEAMWKVYNKMKEYCEVLEKLLESKTLLQEGMDHIFPATFGNQIHSDLDKEYKSPYSNEFSNLHKKFQSKQRFSSKF